METVKGRIQPTDPLAGASRLTAVERPDPLAEALARLSSRMDRVEDATGKTLAIVQGHTKRFDRLEERLQSVEADLRDIKDALFAIESKL